MDINPITNGMIDISTIPVTCWNCDCAFVASQNIKDREIVICPICGLVMMASIQEMGLTETLNFVVVEHDREARQDLECSLTGELYE